LNAKSKPLTRGPGKWADWSSVRQHVHELRRETILQQAARSFRAKGYRETTMDDLAQQLGISKAALYYYVQNKEDILVEIQRSGFDGIVAGLDDLLAGDESGAGILRNLMVRYAKWVTTEFGMCVVTLFNIRISTENSARLRDVRRTLDSHICSVLDRGVKDGSLRPCEPRLVANAIFGAFNWLAFWYDESRHGPPSEIGDKFMTLFTEGIGTRGRRRRG
jgi:AcrR family transcriptional regulator